MESIRERVRGGEVRLSKLCEECCDQFDIEELRWGLCPDCGVGKCEECGRECDMDYCLCVNCWEVSKWVN